MGLCVAVPFGCSAPQTVALEALDRLARATGAKTVVAVEDLTVWSPYGPRLTAELVDMIRQECRAVRRLFEIESGPPVFVWLEAVESVVDENGVPTLDVLCPQKSGVQGLADAGGNVIVLYVPTDPLGASASPALIRHTVRHELAHVGARRKGLRPDRWFSEGLAEFVANLQRTSDGRLATLLPPLPEIWRARVRRPEHSLESLLEWSPQVRDRAVIVDYYLLSLALVQFLLGRRTDQVLLDSIESTARMTRSEVLALEAKWTTWLESVDYVSVLYEAAGSEDPAVRKAAAGMLATLAEFRCPAVKLSEATDLAARMLSDPATVFSATSFLVFFRSKDLDEERVQALIDSQKPFTQLVGHALRVRRGGRPQPEQYEDAYAELSKPEMRAFMLIQRDLFPDGLPGRKGSKEAR